MAQEMKYICWYDDYDRKLAKLSDQELGRLLRACMKYHMTGEMQELAGREAVAYDFIVTDIDNAGRSYAEKCATNAENARKGAAARWGDQGNADRHSKNAENGERHFGNAENAQKEEQEQENRKKEQEKKESVRENAAGAASHAPRKPEKVKYAETVSMREEDYQKLVGKYGEALTQKMIEKLDNYKAANGKKYKDDYRAILNWVAEEVEKKYPNLIRRSAPSFEGNPFAEYLEGGDDS